MIIGNDEVNKLIDMHEPNKYYDEFVDINLSTNNDSHAYLCKRVSSNSTVLDIGCAQGIIGKILKTELNCNVYGIELSNEAILIAKKSGYYTKLYNFDILCKKGEDFKCFKNDNLKFDYIIFADVLEHLYDPGEALLFCFDYLKKDGKILVSLPNISHYDIIDGLLNDKFNYSKMGLLDNTHIRFFTKYSFAEYIKSIGEKYNKKIDLIHFNSTFVKPSFYSNYKNLNKLLRNHKNYLVLQNMFEIIPDSKNIDNLNKLLAEKRANITKQLDDLLSDYNDIENKYNKLVEDYLRIKNDKLRLIITNSSMGKKGKKSLFHKVFRTVDELIKIKKCNTNQSILFFVHSWKSLDDSSLTSIGGTTLHVVELVNRLKSKNNCYVVTIINGKYMLVVIEEEREYIYDLGIFVKYDNFNGYDFDFYRTMISIILNLKIDLLHVHHIVNFPCDLTLLSEKFPTIFTIHDYSFLCYRFFLLDNNGKICDRHDYDKCKSCVENYTRPMYELRKESIKGLLMNSKVVIVPDDSILDKLRLIYNCKNVKVLPHGFDFSSFDKFNKRFDLQVGNVINVAFVGSVEGHKGGKIVKDLIDNSGHNINVHLFGVISDFKYQENKANYYYHGIYRKSEIPKLLNDNKIDIVLFLNQCEESFSYTLSEVIFSGVPSISFSGGAIGNRIKKGKLGWVVSKTDNYMNVINKIEEVRNNYADIKKNVLNYHLDSIDDYVSTLTDIYSLYCSHLKKNIGDDFQYLHNYYLFKIMRKKEGKK